MGFQHEEEWRYLQLDVTEQCWQTLRERRDSADIRLYFRIFTGKASVAADLVTPSKSPHHNTRVGIVKSTISTDVWDTHSATEFTNPISTRPVTGSQTSVLWLFGYYLAMPATATGSLGAQLSGGANRPPLCAWAALGSCGRAHLTAMIHCLVLSSPK